MNSRILAIRGIALAIAIVLPIWAALIAGARFLLHRPSPGSAPAIVARNAP